jgi:hypothetical protein
LYYDSAPLTSNVWANFWAVQPGFPEIAALGAVRMTSHKARAGVASQATGGNFFMPEAKLWNLLHWMNN